MLGLDEKRLSVLHLKGIKCIISKTVQKCYFLSLIKELICILKSRRLYTVVDEHICLNEYFTFLYNSSATYMVPRFEDLNSFSNFKTKNCCLKSDEEFPHLNFHMFRN